MAANSNGVKNLSLWIILIDVFTGSKNQKKRLELSLDNLTSIALFLLILTKLSYILNKELHIL
ncbi:MAG: hypothetical protein LBS83_02095 [Holosporales bacterium]|nr:hypothetical protein [Holosporales bacterium]